MHNHESAGEQKSAVCSFSLLEKFSVLDINIKLHNVSKYNNHSG